MYEAAWGRADIREEYLYTSSNYGSPLLSSEEPLQYHRAERGVCEDISERRSEDGCARLLMLLKCDSMERIINGAEARSGRSGR
jgi:hypothetical protein